MEAKINRYKSTLESQEYKGVKRRNSKITVADFSNEIQPKMSKVGTPMCTSALDQLNASIMVRKMIQNKPQRDSLKFYSRN